MERIAIPAHRALIESPLGRLLLESDGERLTALRFDPESRPSPSPCPVLREAGLQLRAYFQGELTAFDLPISPTGTAFQRSVWETVLCIPRGQAWSYQRIADRLGGQGAARAVGAANGANPLPIIVPCHRVIGADGSLTGYVGGLWRKRWLLRHEGALAGDLFAPP
jgi:methylated-DNA-[protein]-cysteine S-methyltransferase